LAFFKHTVESWAFFSAYGDSLARAITTGEQMGPQEQSNYISATPDAVAPPAEAAGQQEPPKLQKLGAARRRQGLSVRCVAQRLGRTVSEVRAQEEEHVDISISDLYRWQAALEVPIEELLHDPQDTLSTRVLTRARLLRVMKTAIAIRRQARSEAERRLARQLVDQLVEIMPELSEVSGWPAVGHRRTAEDIGRIAENPISEDWLHEAS
jgi:transcriptional regulator with XRE-family HTH domain